MKKNTEISERVRQVIDYLNVNENQFAKSLAYKRSQSIYDIVNGKSKPSFDFFNKLFNSEYSELINPIWLLTGKENIAPKTKPIQENNPKIIGLLEKVVNLQDKNAALKDQLAKIKKEQEPNFYGRVVAEPKSELTSKKSKH